MKDNKLGFANIHQRYRHKPHIWREEAKPDPDSPFDEFREPRTIWWIRYLQGKQTRIRTCGYFSQREAFMMARRVVAYNKGTGVIE